MSSEFKAKKPQSKHTGKSNILECIDSSPLEEVYRYPHSVDKTMLIKHFFETQERLIIITRPRGWSKTTNLKTVEKFFAYCKDREGNDDLIKAKKLRKNFSHLKISRKWPGGAESRQKDLLFTEYFLNTPVVSLCFSPTEGFSGTLLEEFQKNLAETIAKSFK
jgi:hypothetical protein